MKAYDAVGAVGVGLIGYAMWLIYQPLLYLTLGGAFLAFAIIRGRHAERAQAGEGD